MQVDKIGTEALTDRLRCCGRLHQWLRWPRLRFTPRSADVRGGTGAKREAMTLPNNAGESAKTVYSLDGES